MKKIILIIDDEPANLALLSQVMQEQYRVLAATSGAKGLTIARAQPRPDLVLLDVMMPEMDGYEVIARLREEPELRSIPVIFVTALGDVRNEEHGLRLGAVDYITKPINPAIVLARVATQLELKEARDRLSDQNAWLESELTRRQDQISAIQEVGIHALAELAETRDPETGNHIRRTQAYVAILARELRSHPRFNSDLGDAAIARMVASAPLHDIGKVGIPDAVLLKPGRLSDEERVVMQTHAALGAEAIERALRHSSRPVDFLNTAREIARWHHERWDGNGYPDGLVADAIPVSARLMAVADVFDALISARVYKPALPFDEARRIILAGRGTQFDPDVADAFERQFDEFTDIAGRYQDAGDV